MSNLVIPAPEQHTIPTSDGGAFPVRRVYCIGRNYAAHAVEMGYDPDKSPPFFFQKNPNNLDPSGEFPYPDQTNDLHHELEMAVALKSGGVNIAVEDALDHVWGYASALDMTRRDVQNELKKTARPWETAKAFERSAPVGVLHPVSEVGHPTDAAIRLEVNGETRQEGNLNQMVWKVPEMIAYLSNYFELAAGDVILTGTPAGVSAVVRGDQISARVAGLSDLNVTVV